MIVVDSSALIAMLRYEPEANHFSNILSAASMRLVSAVSLLETSMVFAGAKRGAEAWIRLDELRAHIPLTIVSHDAELAHLARLAFIRYGKGRHPAALNMGDCATYALAKSRNVPLLFKGNDFSQTDLTPAHGGRL
jgi:ribonuclease VapC